MVENIFRHLAEASAGHRSASIVPPRGMTNKIAIIFEASGEVTKAIFFAATIIIAGFLPLFTLSGVEGHIFGPMAKTLCLCAGWRPARHLHRLARALGAAAQREGVGGRDDRRAHAARRLRPSDRLRPARQRVTLALAAGLIVVTGFIASTVGLEFLPKLEEGNIWLRATMPASVSLDEGNDYVNRMRKLVRGFPEVETVISQHGRPDDGTDPDGFSNGEVLRAAEAVRQMAQGSRQGASYRRNERRPAQGLPRRLLRLLAVHPGQVQEAASGIDAENAIKISGPNLETLNKISLEIRRVLDGVSGIKDIAVPPLLGQPTIRIDIDRRARRPLRPLAGRRQCHGAGRGRRTGGGAISTRRAATGISRCWCGWRRAIASTCRR